MNAIYRFVAIAIGCVVAAAPVFGVAASDRSLKNVRGKVSAQAGGRTTNIAPNAQLPVGDNDLAITDVNSMGDLIMPDSSEVLIGQSTRIQVQSFTPNDVNTAKFDLQVGKVRFKVRHPGGAKANYNFSTGTGQIAVRGSDGDIWSQGNSLQINVYETNPQFPVEVKLNNGKIFFLHSGESLSLNIAGAVVATQGITSVTRQTFTPFHEFGLPNNALKLGLVTAAAVPAAIAAAAVVPVAAIVVSQNKNSVSAPSATPTPTPSPSPSPTPTVAPTPTPTPVSVPITIQNAPVQKVPGNATMPGAPRVPGSPGAPGPGAPGSHVPMPPNGPGGNRPVTPPSPVAWFAGTLSQWELEILEA